MKTQHTPTPWKVENKQQTTINGREFKFLPTPLNVTRFYTPQESIAGLPTTLTIADCVNLSDANAALIVRAVNSHQELLEMLTILKDCFTDNDGERENFEATISRETLKRAEKAIAKAEGRK